MTSPLLRRELIRYGQQQKQRIDLALREVRRHWLRVGTDFHTGWARVAPVVYAAVERAQVDVATRAATAFPSMIQAQGLTTVAPNTRGLIGVTGDGRPVETLLDLAPQKAVLEMADGDTAYRASNRVLSWLTVAVGSVLSDTARGAESISIATTPHIGYTRVLVTPSCSRCVVLAGQWYRWNDGFQRHPKCDCRHIPTPEADGPQYTIDPARYFESLSAAQQDKTFTKSGAEAIRDGADIYQVVNARRGMTTAAGENRRIIARNKHGLYTTSEGSTRRGYARRAGRYQGARLMPESIYEMAESREHAIELLRRYGYL